MHALLSALTVTDLARLSDKLALVLGGTPSATLTLALSTAVLDSVDAVRPATGDSGGPMVLKDGHAYPVGKCVFIRTVTMFLVGKLVHVTSGELVLKDAAWVADSGRWAQALATGVLSEVEPFPDGDVVVARGGVIDCCVWSHPLPRTVK